MKYKIAICDDREQDAQWIACAVRQWAAQASAVLELEVFPSAESFLFRYEEQKDYDILLLDIEMGSLNGVELARKIRRENESVQIVFITGFSDFMADGYEVSALHYLMKPVLPNKLWEVLDRAAKRLCKAERCILLPGEGETMRIPVSSIALVEAAAHSCDLTTVDGRFEVKASITAIEKLLSQEDEYQFVRCHRSYLVGVPYIKSIAKTQITLDNGDIIPLSRSRYHGVNQAFIRYFKGESQWD